MLFGKERSPVEILNDIDPELMTFFRSDTTPGTAGQPPEVKMQKDQPPFNTRPCPECGGTLAFSQDNLGPYLECGPCGKIFEFKVSAPGNPPETPEQSPATEPDPLMPQLIEDGCEASTSCLECPLPQCKFDDPAGYQAIKQKQKDQERFKIIKEEGLSIEQAADRFRVTRRTIQRMQARLRASTNT